MAMAHKDPQSRNETILQNILGELHEILPAQSRVEAILQAILYDTEYTEEAQSRIEALLLAIKNGGSFDDEARSRNEAILIAKLNGEEYTAEPQSRIEELLIEWANVPSWILKTVTGSVVTVDDAIAAPAEELTVNLPVTQSGSGTPSPDNIRDFIGVNGVTISRTGKNLFNKTTILNDYFITGNTGLPVLVKGFYCSDFIPVKPNITYTTNTVSTGVNKFAMYDSSYSHIASSSLSTYTMPSNCAFIRINGKISEISADDVMVVEGSELPSAYEPFGNIYQITFGQTVYSAILDVLTGILSITHEIVDLGNLAYQYRDTYELFYTGVNRSVKLATPNCACSGYLFNPDAIDTSISNISRKINDKEITTFENENNQGRFVIKDTNYTDVHSFKEAIAGMKLVYELAEPIEIQLTPVQVQLLKGNNTLFVYSGDLTLTYKAKA